MLKLVYFSDDGVPKKVVEYVFKEALPVKAKSSSIRKPCTHSFPFRGSRLPLQRKRKDVQLTPMFKVRDWIGQVRLSACWRVRYVVEGNTTWYVPDPKHMFCTRAYTIEYLGTTS